MVITADNARKIVGEYESNEELKDKQLYAPVYENVLDDIYSYIQNRAENGESSCGYTKSMHRTLDDYRTFELAINKYIIPELKKNGFKAGYRAISGSSYIIYIISVSWG